MLPAIDVTNIILETERLRLRAWTETDLNDFYEYASVSGVGEMAGWPHHERIETSKTVLNSFIADKNVFALELKENGKVIGSLGLHHSFLDDHMAYESIPMVEIGYALSKAYWGRGLMPEAVKRLIGFCFETLLADIITVSHYKFNHQSRRVIEKCGFQRFDEADHYSELLQRHFDSVRYTLRRQKA